MQCNNQLDKREAMQQPANQEAQERGNRRQWNKVRRDHATVMRDNRAGRRCNNQPWLVEAMEGGGCRVVG
jgi:hypothetical protein